MLFAMGVLKMIPGLVPDIEHVSFLSSLYYARGAAIKEFSIRKLFGGCFPFILFLSVSMPCTRKKNRKQR